jgi:hypothetical protein
VAEAAAGYSEAAGLHRFCELVREFECLNQQGACERRQVEKHRRTAFDGDSPGALRIANVSGTMSEDRNELHGCGEHKCEGVWNSHLEQSVGQRVGRGGLKEKKEDCSNGEQPETGDDAGIHIESKPGDDEENENGEAQAF